MGTRSIFALEASDAEIACECGGSVLRTEYDGRDYRVYVPCGLCSETHMAICPPERMLHGATALSCGQTGQFTCFIGDEGTVEKNLRELAILAERRETLRRAWSRLDDGARDLLAGKYILEKSDDEIAEELGCASGSVRMKLTRARRRLLETMKEEEADHGKT